jgi:hypothetical protein
MSGSPPLAQVQRVGVPLVMSEQVHILQSCADDAIVVDRIQATTRDGVERTSCGPPVRVRTHDVVHCCVRRRERAHIGIHQTAS